MAMIMCKNVRIMTRQQLNIVGLVFNTHMITMI